MPVVMKAKRLLPVAALSLLVLSGCAQDPNVAARVQGQAISDHEVDVLSTALCAERSGSSGAAPTSLASVRSSALAALIDSHVDADLAKKNGLTYEPLTLAKQMQQLDTLIAKLPSGDQKLGTTLITDLLRGQLQLQQAVVRQLESSGQQPTDQNVAAGVQQLESQHVATLSVKVNPRYDFSATSASGDGSQSVSEAVSSEAKSAIGVLQGKTETAYVAGLPAAQKCG